MQYKVQNGIGKLCALLAATLILPGLAFAGHDKDDKGKEKGGEEKHIPVVPEANAGWVLVPFLGAVLLYSWRKMSLAKG